MAGDETKSMVYDYSGTLELIRSEGEPILLLNNISKVNHTLLNECKGGMRKLLDAEAQGIDRFVFEEYYGLFLSNHPDSLIHFIKFRQEFNMRFFARYSPSEDMYLNYVSAIRQSGYVPDRKTENDILPVMVDLETMAVNYCKDGRLLQNRIS